MLSYYDSNMIHLSFVICFADLPGIETVMVFESGKKIGRVTIAYHCADYPQREISFLQ